MNVTGRLTLDDIHSRFLHHPIPYAVISPEGADQGPFPLCVVLHGGGGSRQSLADCIPLFEAWWSDGSMAPMILASPSAGMSYYVQDPATNECWDDFIAKDFVDHLQTRFNVRRDRPSTWITGMSMGGYGALKIAFAFPERFGAAAAMSAVLEPGLHDDQIPARNRMHHSAGGPSRLIGNTRDRELFEANNPANRAIANVTRLRQENLAIYIETGDDDFINVHDGSEYLHRVLWNLDIPHEYRLTRGADHAGPTLIPRMRQSFSWLSSESYRQQPDETIRMLRAQIEPARNLARALDPTTDRRFGRLPVCD